MNDDIIIEGVGSFDRAFVHSKSKEAWIAYMREVNPKFTQAEDVWHRAVEVAKQIKASEENQERRCTPLGNYEPKTTLTKVNHKKKKEDVPDSDDQL